MAIKMRVRIGDTELEYEGDEGFLKNGVPAVIAEIAQSLKAGPAARPGQPGRRVGAALEDVALKATTATLASRLGVKQGSDLIVAAAARLTLGLGGESFTRKELIEEMKKASGYYKATYVDNLTNYLNRMLKDGRLMQPADDTFALSAKARAEVLSRMGDS